MDTINITWWEELTWRGYIMSEDGSQFCQVNPATVNSFGMWEIFTFKAQGMGFWEYPLPNLEFMILAAFLLWRFFDFLCKKSGFRIPKFTCMMLAGLVLSQASLLSQGSLIRSIVFPDDYKPKIPETLGAFGFLLYWFLKGVTMDIGTFAKTGKKSVLIGFTTMAVPLLLGSIVFIIRMRAGKMEMTLFEYRAIIFMNSVSPFTGIDTLLRDLKFNHSEFGRIALSSATVTDMMAFVITFLSAIRWDKALGILQSLVACVFFASMFFLVRPAMFWVIRQTPEGRPIKDIYIYVVLMLAYLSFHYWHHMGQFGPAGSFVLGWAIPDGPPLGSALVHRFENFNFGIILPLFGSLAAMQVDLQWLIGEIKNFTHMDGRVYEAMSMILLLSATKFISSIIVAFAVRMPLRDSIVLALALSNKGIFELAFFVSFVELKVVHPKVFTIMATAILMNSLFIPITIKLLHDPSEKFRCYGRRNLLNLKDDSELHALVCIHKPDHITSMINLLEAFQPSEHSPVSCYVLHLIQLVGRAIPNFISHQVQKPAVGSQSCSDNVIASFKCFHQKFSDSTSLYMFTSFSMVKHMHEDICWLALTKGLSLILLPFHRTWSIDRSTIVSDDDTMRSVNRNILRQAPCSVGIFVYRKPLRNPQMTDSNIKVCLIFLGGKDDMEAMALTNRMRRTNREISLTFLRFIPKTSVWDSKGTMQDLMDRKEIMERNDCFDMEGHHPVAYLDNEVSDGSETSMFLRSMAHEYDLFIVGRSSGRNSMATRGITEWTEFEELGPIGDLLASKDFPTRASVLVVQQQDFRDHR
ncbi:PREDICTED: cation/H(+) antiporter 6A-like [Tarenaya hassleriana]|uniref:cation/H(+) antiporter 6A-like n=1 Tax=Tarenaya hassleriana TaxID=28532 RepID=UPI00053C9165|nr:PREDICTED: cation/H(+) antiporter 6A-like [Tarenaya hassleriana]XP_010557365.1 PREDICTED: cation/H(+) antiporter 6A-like [Tarenaya hassleriana]